MEYIEETKLGEAQKQEIFKLVESMKSLGVNDEANLQSVTFGQINSIHDGIMSRHGIDMLEKKFGIKRELDSLNSGKLKYVNCKFGKRPNNRLCLTSKVANLRHRTRHDHDDPKQTQTQTQTGFEVAFRAIGCVLKCRPRCVGSVKSMI